MSIQSEHARIIKNLTKWKTALKVLQETCHHADKDQEYGSNTGNYDPTSDCYWVMFTCNDCGKIWREDL
jgi:hypothetical protein